MSNALVFNIQKFSVHDGPGIRSIVFFKGCPLRCQWCANPESQEFDKELLIYPDKCIACGECAKVCESGCYSHNAESQVMFDRSKCTNCCKCAQVCYAGAHKATGEAMTYEEIIEELDKDMIFYETSGGGITFSGGEAMCYPDEVREIARNYKEKGINTAMETCGCVPWENFEQVLSYIDLFMYDIKVMDEEKHIKYTGGTNSQILENIKKLAPLKKVVVRIPIIPGINDSEEDILAFGEFLGRLNGAIDTVHLLPYHNMGIAKYQALGRDYLLNETELPEDAHMQQIKKRFEAFGFRTIIGG